MSYSLIMRVLLLKQHYLPEVIKTKLQKLKRKGYAATLLFFWLESVELAKERVRTRVLKGGHNIEPDVIERRYLKGIKNLFEIYLPIIDGALIFDNSFNEPVLLANKEVNE